MTSNTPTRSPWGEHSPAAAPPDLAGGHPGRAGILGPWPVHALESSAPQAPSARSRSSSSPSAGTTCAHSRRHGRPGRGFRSATREIVVEEATPAALSAGDVDLFLFSVGTEASRKLVPIASAAGAICIDKSSAYRLVDGYPLVVPEVNAHRALEALERDRIVANPNCCTIPLTCVLKPLHDVVPTPARSRRDLPVRIRRRSAADGAAPVRDAGRAQRGDGLGLGRRRVRRGVEAAGRDAQDPGAARPRDQRDVRSGSRARRALGGDLGRVRRAALASGCDSDPERSAECPRAAAARGARRRRMPPAGTRCWSAGSAATRAR